MRQLVEAFPKSILAFTTMREFEKMTEDDITNIKELAKWGRQHKAPVMILTGTELFTKDSLLKSWFERGGKHQQLAMNMGLGTGIDITPRNLAYWTQHLYLEMPLPLKKHRE